MNEVKLSEVCIKDLTLALNLQLFENGVISEELYKQAQNRLKKAG